MSRNKIGSSWSESRAAPHFTFHLDAKLTRERLVNLESFRPITIQGDAVHRGESYGRQLGDEILQTIEVYKELWQREDADILSRADCYRQLLRKHDDEKVRDYATEIDSIAKAIRLSRNCEFNPLWLFALNARTELLSLTADECTSIYFQPTALLGQNWDWAECFEDLAILLTIVPEDGPTIWTLTEPGIIGKIGMNSAGIGVCLNILRCGGAGAPSASNSIEGLPIHLTLRMILESPTLNAARQAIQSHAIHTTSNILVGDATGCCFVVEFAGSEQHWLPCSDDVTYHTNHYCHDLARSRNEPFESDLQSSYVRYDRTKEILSHDSSFSMESMKRVLLDRTGTLPINRPYRGYPIFPKQHEVGTVATLLMDLQQRKMEVLRGPRDISEV